MRHLEPRQYKRPSACPRRRASKSSRRLPVQLVGSDRLASLRIADVRESVGLLPLLLPLPFFEDRASSSRGRFQTIRNLQRFRANRTARTSGTPRPSPSAVRRHGSSSAPSAAPADAGTSACAFDPVSLRGIMWHSGRKSHLRQSASLLASIWSFFFLAAAIARSINGCQLVLGLRQQVIVDPAAEDRRLHRHGPRLG